MYVSMVLYRHAVSPMRRARGSIKVSIRNDYDPHSKKTLPMDFP
jgi:hypothetical protein